MSYDYKKLFDVIVREVSADGSFGIRMMAIVDECESQLAHKDWGVIRKIDFDSDANRLEHWLKGALAEAPTPSTLRGLWFGLYNPVVGEEATADIYVSASESFDESSIDWACNSSFFPASDSLGSNGLASIYNIAYGSTKGLENDAEYPLVLAYGAMLARAAIESLNITQSPLPMLEGAAVGFDDGDLLFLGRVEDGLFRTHIRAG